jgi:hypothetical protein
MAQRIHRARKMVMGGHNGDRVTARQWVHSKAVFIGDEGS